MAGRIGSNGHKKDGYGNNQPFSKAFDMVFCFQGIRERGEEAKKDKEDQHSCQDRGNKG